jgi:hypothetical protein
MSTLTGAPSVRLQGGRGRGGRGFPRHGGRGAVHQPPSIITSARRGNSDRSNSEFLGSEPSLQGHIYDYTGERDPDGYIKTTKEISNYIGRKFNKYQTELAAGFDALDLPMPVEPTLPAPEEGNAFAIQFELFKANHKIFLEKTQAYKDFKGSMYSIILGQCTERMRDSVESHTRYPHVKAVRDGIELMKIIKELSHTYEGHSKAEHQVAEALKKFYGRTQGAR